MEHSGFPFSRIYTLFPSRISLSSPASPYIALAILLSLSFWIPEINVWLPGETHFPCHFFRRKPEWLVEPPPPFTYCQTLPRKRLNIFTNNGKVILCLGNWDGYFIQWSLWKTDNWWCYWCTIVLLIIVREAWRHERLLWICMYLHK